MVDDRSLLLINGILYVARINSNVTPEVIRRLNENRPTNLDQREFESIIYTWAQHWIPEFVSDCFAAKTLGPAFIGQFMVTVLDRQPNHVEMTHPPPNLRVGFMINILDTLNLSDIDISSYRNMWQSYAHSVSRPSSLFIVQEDVVTTALRGIDSIVTEKPVENKWGDILETKKAISRGLIPDHDLVSTISAMAIAEPNLNYSPLYKALLKRYASNSYACCWGCGCCHDKF